MVLVGALIEGAVVAGDMDKHNPTHVCTARMVLDAARQTVLTDSDDTPAPPPLHAANDAALTIKFVVEASACNSFAELERESLQLDLSKRRCADALLGFLAKRETKAAESLVFDEEARTGTPALATAHEVLSDLAADLAKGEQQEVPLVYYMGRTIKWARDAGINLLWLPDEQSESEMEL